MTSGRRRGVEWVTPGPFQAANPCVDTTRIPIRDLAPRALRDSLLVREACWLVGAAIAEVAAGKAERLGISRADTARIDAAGVMVMRDPSDSEWSYWTVELRFTGKEVMVAVHTWWSSRKVTVTNTEGPWRDRP